MANPVREFLEAAARRRSENATPEHRARRAEVDARNERLQAGPIVRGPNKPQSGTFGGTK